MRKIHDVLRLYYDLKLAQRQIARSVQLSQSTVNDYLVRFQQSGLSWPLSEDYDDQKLNEQLFGAAKSDRDPTLRPLPDFTYIQHELTTNRHTCLQLLWEEYREAHAERPYSYTSFWRHFDQWRSRQDLVMRQQHRAGEKLFVDWAGAKIPIHDRATGDVTLASLFVAVLGASSYTYAEAALTQELEPWICAHVRTFEFLEGVTKPLRGIPAAPPLTTSPQPAPFLCELHTSKVCSTSSPLDLLPHPIPVETTPATPVSEHRDRGSSESGSGGRAPPLRRSLSTTAWRVDVSGTATRNDRDRGVPYVSSRRSP